MAAEPSKDAESQDRNEKPKQHPLRPWLEFAGLILFIFAARSSFADWNHVPSGSMKPTIAIGDLVFVERLAYDLKLPFTTMHLARWDDPVRGDIVVFESPHDGERLIKRVIGIPGDEVAMRRGQLFLNGEPLDYREMETEDHSGFATLSARERASHMVYEEDFGNWSHPVMYSEDRPQFRDFGPVLVPAESYFVLGDNRDHSADSRAWRETHFVPREAILGRARRVLVSFDYQDYFLPRSDRWMYRLD